MTLIVIFATIGLVLSIYSFLVERKVKEDSLYKAACDISDTISCTRPMLSSYNAILGISNSLVSILYYLAIIALAFLQQQRILTLMTSAGLITTFIFAYILYFKLRSLCLICTSLYIINITLALICYFSMLT